MAVSALQLGELALYGAAFLCGVVCASALTVTQVPARRGGLSGKGRAGEGSRGWVKAPPVEKGKGNTRPQCAPRPWLWCLRVHKP